MKESESGRIMVDSAVHLHQALGPGLLESVYEVTLARELEKRQWRRGQALNIDIDAG